MSSPVPPPLAARPHRNQQLFADHYLDVTLPGRAAWRAQGNDKGESRAWGRYVPRDSGVKYSVAARPAPPRARADYKPHPGVGKEHAV